MLAKCYRIEQRGRGLLGWAAEQARTHRDFTGKTAIITGGARGLGLSYARALAAGGARLVISDEWRR
ncbi:hypothetical protein PFUM301597_20670 [Pseudomonas fluorescens]